MLQHEVNNSIFIVNSTIFLVSMFLSLVEDTFSSPLIFTEIYKITAEASS